MLVISRKPGESIYISDNIKITVSGVSGDKVTLAISAPKDIKIVREELFETIEANLSGNTKLEEENVKNIASLIKTKKLL